MSYEEFKKRIDTARNILVGAVPSPAGQIDQITYALMYKFMNDIDDKAASITGGKRKYFIGDFEKYNWHALMSTSLGAHERLELYRQAIQNMAKNDNLPELFRSIYQNAFLPFNSANVLSMFLKEMDKFSQADSDDIGDAYEYLLSITGAQGDVGQFRTPRHIIKFIVEAVNPSKDDSVLDPACGTAGFLIAAYLHVVHQHDGKDEQGNSNDEIRMTADELAKLHKNYRGFDIDPTMVRTAKVNMYLHDFKTPEIINHDSLSSEDYWNDKYDVILANPPFMTPKGGIQPHKKFGIIANRAEVLFVDYIASHLKPTGRAGVVVPEGIIFQSGKAYKELRKNLVENYLYAVVSLPAGIFQPYSGVKTSVLLFDKELAKQNDKILFVKIENDGYSLGAQRRKAAGDEMPQALKLIEAFKNGEEVVSALAHEVSRNQIAENGDYNLSGDRYKLAVPSSALEWPLVKLGDIIHLKFGERITKSKSNGTLYPVYGGGGESFRTDNFNRKNEYVIARFAMSENCVRYVKDQFWLMDSGGSLAVKTGSSHKVDKDYIGSILLGRHQDIYACARGGAQKNLNNEHFYQIQIPLPPIETQREIVAELDSYQKIIDAAQTIVKTYKPKIKINPDWRKQKLSELVSFIGGGTPSRTVQKYWGGNIKWITSKYFGNDHSIVGFENITAEGLTSSSSNIAPKGSTIVISRVSVGKYAFADEDYALNQDLTALVPKDNAVINNRYLFYAAASIAEQIKKSAVGIGVTGVTRQFINDIEIYLPPLDEQKQILDGLESEQSYINANKKLIEIYAQKIKSKIAEVWGE